MKIIISNPATESRHFSLKQPCSECPFSRACAPGGTGGTDPTVYVGQAYGAFFLPCHQDQDYRQESALDHADVIAQCAGAAIFRSNVGVSERLPLAIHRLPPSPARVFANAAELIAHHNQMTLVEAEEILRRTPPGTLLATELDKLDESHYVAVHRQPRRGTR
jgi:hypothetical protein